MKKQINKKKKTQSKKNTKQKRKTKTNPKKKQTNKQTNKQKQLFSVATVQILLQWPLFGWSFHRVTSFKSIDLAFCHVFTSMIFPIKMGDTVFSFG